MTTTMTTDIRIVASSNPINHMGLPKMKVNDSMRPRYQESAAEHMPSDGAILGADQALAGVRSATANPWAGVPGVSTGGTGARATGRSASLRPLSAKAP
jgi:hypothetical protein